MAFDIYAGTFTRFYTREWENVVQRQARIDGTQYKMIYAGGEQQPPSAEEVLAVVTAWRNGINNALAQHNLGPLDWSEANEQPYFTDRPGWEGYSGLQLWAAYAERPEQKPPYQLPKEWASDEVWQAVIENDEAMHFRTILQASVWLPGDFEFSFKFPGITEEEVMIASTSALRDQLLELGSKPLSWASSSPLASPRQGEVVPFQEAATWGQRTFLSIAEQAVSAKVPLMLSF